VQIENKDITPAQALRARGSGTEPPGGPDRGGHVAGNAAPRSPTPGPVPPTGRRAGAPLFVENQSVKPIRMVLIPAQVEERPAPRPPLQLLLCRPDGFLVIGVMACARYLFLAIESRGFLSPSPLCSRRLFPIGNVTVKSSSTFFTNGVLHLIRARLWPRLSRSCGNIGAPEASNLRDKSSFSRSITTRSTCGGAAYSAGGHRLLGITASEKVRYEDQSADPSFAQPHQPRCPGWRNSHPKKCDLIQNATRLSRLARVPNLDLFLPRCRVAQRVQPRRWQNPILQTCVSESLRRSKRPACQGVR
jgi:hypothetical protein